MDTGGKRGGVAKSCDGNKFRVKVQIKWHPEPQSRPNREEEVFEQDEENWQMEVSSGPLVVPSSSLQTDADNCQLTRETCLEGAVHPVP